MRNISYLFSILMALCFVSGEVGLANNRGGGGSEGGGGAGIIARLLVFSQAYLIEEIPNLKTEYPKTLLQDVKNLKFVAVDRGTELTDPHFGYKTWIRIVPGTPIQIEYIPEAEYYAQIVANLEGNSDKTPRLRDVLGFLLHELGHHYGMGEEDAWKFAFAMQDSLEKSSSIQSLRCRFSLQEGLNPMVRREFVLRPTDEITLRSEEIRFEFRNVFLETGKPQFMMSVFGEKIRTALRVNTNSVLDYANEISDLKFSVHCLPLEPKENP